MPSTGRTTEESPAVRPTIAGFEYQRVSVAEDVSLHVAVGGTGTPVVLLHGFPQTHLMWRHVAVDLAVDHTVICPDLRGYGDSDKPHEDGPHTYSKRTMANDVVTLARRLGHPGSRWPGTTGAHWSPSGRASTIRTRSPTWPVWTSCRHSTCGMPSTARRRRSLSISTSWPSRPVSPSG